LELRGGRGDHSIPGSTDARGGEDEESGRGDVGEDETCEFGRGENLLSGCGGGATF